MTDEVFQLVTFANTITYVLPLPPLFRVYTGILYANGGSWPLKLARDRVTQRGIRPVIRKIYGQYQANLRIGLDSNNIWEQYVRITWLGLQGDFAITPILLKENDERGSHSRRVLSSKASLFPTKVLHHGSDRLERFRRVAAGKNLALLYRAANPPPSLKKHRRRLVSIKASA